MKQCIKFGFSFGCKLPNFCSSVGQFLNPCHNPALLGERGDGDVFFFKQFEMSAISKVVKRNMFEPIIKESYVKFLPVYWAKQHNSISSNSKRKVYQFNVSSVITKNDNRIWPLKL